PLMKGMDHIGRLFAANEMIVAEVLQSAEVMKAAVAHLEPHMDNASTASRGKILLATVKGDVHDIGKNLVHIILKNNGYEIIDLGIKVAPETLIEQALKHRPDLIGLSGLLVKSAHQMVATAEDLKNAGITAPLLVGGAALSGKFTATRIAPAYQQPVLWAKDAMQGLDLANQLQDPQQRPKVLAKNREAQASLRGEGVTAIVATVATTATPKAKITALDDIPTPPDLRLHVEQDFNVAEIFRYVNPIMLYGKHLGLKGNLERLFSENDPKALEIKKRVEDIQNEILAKKYIQAKAVYRFFAARSDGDSLMIYDSPSSRNALTRFDFPRQKSAEGLCLTDFVRPVPDSFASTPDYICFFVVTCGAGIMELASQLREKGEYLKSFAIQALAIESAEGFAELLHEKIRAMWGIPDPKEMTAREKFQAKYRGLRVSFGYPACPNLEDQKKLFALLDPAKHIRVTLTEGLMMEPEASVSALVLHHPQARYFSV
ncbi:MAG: vitamin B12 dependent-methionine synthase activation domain-containing protein, partial [Elusimicrobiota bacterium]